MADRDTLIKTLYDLYGKISTMPLRPLAEFKTSMQKKSDKEIQDMIRQLQSVIKQANK